MTQKRPSAGGNVPRFPSTPPAEVEVEGRDVRVEGCVAAALAHVVHGNRLRLLADVRDSIASRLGDLSEIPR